MTEKKRRMPSLSKSRFMAGLQCYKRLYLACYQPNLSDPVSPSRQAVFDSGSDVGKLARNLFPGGILIEADYLHFGLALKLTRDHLADVKRMPLYEAAFQFDNVRTRVDILNPLAPGGYHLIEVKSATSLKDEYIMDAAIQYYVLRGDGVDVTRVSLAYLNKEYVYTGGAYELAELFRIDDITESVLSVQPEVVSSLSQMRLCLAEPEPPEIKPGRHCTQPYECEFSGYCHQGQSEHHISQLPRITDKLTAALEVAGIADIRDIPAGFEGLNDIHQRVRDCIVNDRIFLDDQIKIELAALQYPVHFLDFETFNPALPLYPGTTPYEIIPFQWSDHVMMADGTLIHHEFLADGRGDPRPEFVSTLLAVLGDHGSIVVYSGYEAGRIKALADSFPASEESLQALLPRLFDLLPLVRRYCYHPEFHGSFSIKAVLPALVPDLSYTDLDINDGGLAATAYLEIVDAATPPSRRAELMQQLRRYCYRDTEAMVRLVEKLR